MRRLLQRTTHAIDDDAKWRSLHQMCYETQCKSVDKAKLNSIQTQLWPILFSFVGNSAELQPNDEHYIIQKVFRQNLQFLILMCTFRRSIIKRDYTVLCYRAQLYMKACMGMGNRPNGI